MKKLTTIFFVTLAVAITSKSFAQSSWVAPKSADAIENPLKNDQKATKQGKALYAQLCAVCHGDKGKGDGLASATLTPKPADFSANEFSSQIDGAVYWKLTEGRAPMASYKESLTDTQRWQLVNYLKSLKK
jgi:mono/diheme cytochrome c family protein